MRILLVANTLPPADLSGVGEQVVQLAAGLRQRGHEVGILGRGPDGVRCPKALFPLAAPLAVWRRLRSFPADVVQVHESDGALTVLLLAAMRPVMARPPTLAALLQVSYVEEGRAVRPLRHGRRVLGRPGLRELRFRWLKAPVQALLGRLTVWLVDRVWAPSAATARELARDYGAEDVRVLPNAMRPAPPPSGDDPAIPPEPFLLFVGRLRIRKGLEVLLEAMRDLGAMGVRAPLVVAGDGEHRERLERRARERGVGAEVLFLGRCAPSRVRRLLARCRALVVPSIYEGMPLVVLEAMAAGTAVVASRVSGIPEVVEDGTTGWLVPGEDPPALARALAAVLADEGEAGARGAAGRRRIEERFLPDAVARIWENDLAPGLPSGWQGAGGGKGG